MDYLVHAHDSCAVLAANFLEGLGGIRHIVGIHTKPISGHVALFSTTSPFLNKRFLRRIRLDNEQVLGIVIPSWAREAREIIAINPERMRLNGFENALRQLNSRLSGVPLPRKRRSRRHGHVRDRMGLYPLCG